jgi:hypothetical protein
MLHITIGVPGYCAGKSCAGPGRWRPPLAPLASGRGVVEYAGPPWQSLRSLPWLRAWPEELALRWQLGQWPSWRCTMRVLQQVVHVVPLICGDGIGRWRARLPVASLTGRLLGPGQALVAGAGIGEGFALLHTIRRYQGWITPPTNGVMRRFQSRALFQRLLKAWYAIAYRRLVSVPVGILGLEPNGFGSMVIRLDS